ncbi:MAG: LuxR C-terminal-related transcriptional regulator [Chloroflexota bacterium]
MSPPLLETKLFIPRPRPNLVPGERLIERLSAGIRGKATLVSAPPGFGKTTLVSKWLAGCDRPAAWLSLDASDSDLTHFFTYLVAAIQKIAPDFGADLQAALHAPNPVPPYSLAIVLLNNLVALPDPSIIVLDDYHVIKNKDVRELLAFILEHLPPSIHLIITTREEPDLPLPRLRARGQLVEIGAADLRFTPAETADFLNKSMGLNLSAVAIDTLEQRTEGWVAGLQLAALSLQHKAKQNAFIDNFSGDHRFVADYLVAEVLRTQPDEIRQFLLMTSLPERLNGQLCDALTGRDDGTELLAKLDRGNLFLIPLDESRSWYRYHHLFAELLRTQLGQAAADQVEALHLKASEWFEAQGFPADAIHHAALSGQHTRVAALVEEAWPSLSQIYNDNTLVSWLRHLPDSILRERPRLNVFFAFGLLSANPSDVEHRLNDVDAWLEAPERTPEELERAHSQSVPGMAALARAYRAGALGNLEDTLKYTRAALELLPEDDYFGRGSASAMLGLTHWGLGDLITAYEITKQGLNNMRRTTNPSAMISVMFILADICMAQLELKQAEAICREALTIAVNSKGKSQQGSANIQVILSEIYFERGELKEARAALQASRALGEHAGLEVMRHRWYIAMAMINMVEGDTADAFSNLDEGELVYIGSPAPEIRPIDAIRARFWVHESRFNEARAWFDAQNIVPEKEISHIDLYPMTTLAQCLAAQKDNSRLEGLLKRLAAAAEAAHRTADLIDILVLKTLHTKQLAPLEQALLLAAPEAAIQRFIYGGLSLLPYLKQIKTQDDQLKAFINSIITQLTHPATPTVLNTSPYHPISLPPHPPLDPLSEREIEVLSLMAEGKTNQQIADQLFLTLNTIKVHSRNIYSKLDVHNRTQAVNRARGYGLLSPPNTTFGV